MKNIILINGKKRSGKDFAAAKLKECLIDMGKKTEIMSFAEPMKNIISTTLGISFEDLEDYKNNPDKYKLVLPNSTTDFRKVLQLFGTEAMKPFFGDAVWVDLLMKRAQESDAEFILVPDFRFLCEDIGAATIKVVNDDIKSTDTHQSENELNDFVFQFEIDNTGFKNIDNQIQTLANKLCS